MTTPQRINSAAERAEAAELRTLRLECAQLRLDNDRLARLNRDLLDIAERFRQSRLTLPPLRFRWETPK